MEIKGKLLAQLTNFWKPVIDVVDSNYQNRGRVTSQARALWSRLRL